MNSTPHVLVIDGASDTGTVLKAVLEPRGATVERGRSNLVAARFSAASSPKVLVIDVDTVPDEFHSTIGWENSARVMLGSKKPTSAAERERFLEKPFQFPELIRVIEELLAESPAA